jgi:UDP-N-acetylmuramate--alanine ligase
MAAVRYHFSGVAGAGMNPLARLMAARGHRVQGSDRAFDRGLMAETARLLARDGITLVPHDGSAVGAGLDRFVYSTAVEADTPEAARARACGLPMVARPALLAEVVNAGRPGVAISGTCGKSTVTGLAGWLLERAGCPATVLAGAPRVGEGIAGGLVVGAADGPVVAETCESDGTLVGYRPGWGLVHNVSRDHAELASLRAQFAAFAGQCGRLWVNAGCPEAAAIGRAAGARTYGEAAGCDARLRVTATGPARARGVLEVDGAALALDVPMPGAHNVENAAAAALVALALGVPPAAVEAALPRFPGLARRFEVVGVTAGGVRVVDDYAHNAGKLRAALAAAQQGGDRVLAVFQPHGFGPARFMRADLAGLWPRVLRPRDRLCYAEIYYAGGTVARDVSSAALAADLPASLGCAAAPDHDAVVDWAAREARPGDTVLVMGARDPRLPALARRILAAVASGLSR